MKKLFRVLTFAAFASIAVFARTSVAATTNLITAKVTVTSGTSNGFTFTLNSSTRTSTNAVTSPQTQFATNDTVAGTASNLFYHAGSYGFSGPIKVTGYTNGSNVIYFRAAIGQALAISGLSNWFSVSYSTQTVTSGSIDLRVPVGSADPAAETNAWSLALSALTDYPTNRFPTNAYALGNFINVGPERQTLNNDVFTNGLIARGLVDGSGLTNIPWGQLSNVTVIVLNATSGTLSNMTLLGVLNLTALNAKITNAQLDRPFITNATMTGGSFTGTVVNLGGSGFGTWITLASSSTTASLGPAILFTREDGAGSYAETGDVLMQLSAAGYGDTAFQTAARIRAYAQTNFTDANSPARLQFDVAPVGTSSTAVKLTIDGVDAWFTNLVLHATAAQFNDLIGSNYVSGRFLYKAGTVSSLVNGNNAGIALGTNRVVELSGGTTIAQIAGFAGGFDGDERVLRFTGAVTNWIVNETGSAFSTDSTAANRIVTGTGGDLTQTNQPAWLKIRYRGASSRWEVTDYSR